MRLCANENLPEDCIARLRADGHDVLWIRESAPGSPDHAVLARAYAEHRLLITFDKDFGELVLSTVPRHHMASCPFASRNPLRPWSPKK